MTAPLDTSLAIHAGAGSGKVRNNLLTPLNTLGTPLNTLLTPLNNRLTPLHAFAGSGKTLTLTSRIGWALQSGVPADAVLAMTFTRLAAEQMRQRLSDLIPDPDTVKQVRKEGGMRCGPILLH